MRHCAVVDAFKRHLRNITVGLLSSTGASCAEDTLHSAAILLQAWPM